MQHSLKARFVPSMQLYRPRYKTDISGYNTTRDTLDDIHAPGRAQLIPDTTTTQGHCTDQHRPPIIIMYIKGQTMPAAAGQLLPCADRWQVLHPAHPLRGQPGGVSALPGIETGPDRNRLDLAHVRRCAFFLERQAARNHWRLPPHLFSGCRPIANRGQQ